MDREELRSWLDRWTVVADRQNETVRATSASAKLAELDDLRYAAADLGLASPEDDLSRVRELWSRLRAAK